MMYHRCTAKHFLLREIYLVTLIFPVSFLAAVCFLCRPAADQTSLDEQSVNNQFGYYLVNPLTGEQEDAAKKRVEKINRIPAETFEARKFPAAGKTKLVYRLMKPAGYRPGVKYPLVVVLHGSGAIGDDNTSQLGIFAKSWAQSEYLEKYPCFVLAPQFPARSVEYVKSGDGTVVSQALPPLNDLLELIESIKINIDRKRIYIMGFSMGGSSTLNALSMKPGLFAAAVSIAPVPNAAMAKKPPEIPLWIIHGNNDRENDFDIDKRMYETMIKQGAKNIRFWELAGAGHEVPAQIFAGDEIAGWLFSRHR